MLYFAEISFFFLVLSSESFDSNNIADHVREQRLLLSFAFIGSFAIRIKLFKIDVLKYTVDYKEQNEDNS